MIGGAIRGQLQRTVCGQVIDPDVLRTTSRKHMHHTVVCRQLLGGLRLAVPFEIASRGDGTKTPLGNAVRNKVRIWRVAKEHGDIEVLGEQFEQMKRDIQ